MNTMELCRTAREIRRETLKLIREALVPHVGSCFSIVELLTALYFDVLDLDGAPHIVRDTFILSKGHASAVLYVTLAKRGLLPVDLLKTFARNGGRLGCHPNFNPAWGIDATTGSLGHGLSLGVGLALGKRMNRIHSRVVVLMSDGELNEGSNWEAIMFAGHHGLNNLVGIVDCNKLQALGPTHDIINLEQLEEKWRAFGWAVRRIDGHDMGAVVAAFRALPFAPDRPSCIIADTVKGKGVSFMENNVLWHYRCPDDREFAMAVEELR